MTMIILHQLHQKSGPVAMGILVYCDVCFLLANKGLS